LCQYIYYVLFITMTSKSTCTLIVETEEKEMDLTQIYIQQLSALERKAFDIACAHLESSFNICKSNGFIEWLKKHNNKVLNK